MSTTTYRYVGGREAVDIKLPSGRVCSVARGETIEVGHIDALAIDRHPEWEHVEPAPSPAPSDPDEEPTS